MLFSKDHISSTYTVISFFLFFLNITQYVFRQLPEERALTCCLHLWVMHVDEESDSSAGFTALKKLSHPVWRAACVTAALHYGPLSLLFSDTD